MKMTSSLLVGAVVVLAMAASPLTFAQTASSAPENNRTDGNASNGSMGDATPRTDTSSPKFNDTQKKNAQTAGDTDKKPVIPNNKATKGSDNDTSHQPSGGTDQTKSSKAIENAPGD